jgi:hypothetical protein
LLGNLLNALCTTLLPWGVRNTIHRDEIDVCVAASQHLDERRRIVRAIVNPINHRHLKGGSTSRCPCMCSGGRHHLLHWPLPIQWNEQIAQWVARGVK